MSPNAFKTSCHALLGLLMVDPLDALDDHTLALNLDTLDDLVLTLKKREICLDAVEVGAVGDVEDRPRLEALARIKDLLGLVHLQVVHEDCELLPEEFG